MRAHEQRRMDQLVAAAGMEDARQLPGPARLALGKLVASALGDALVDGICAYAEAAHQAGRIDEASTAYEQGYKDGRSGR